MSKNNCYKCIHYAVCKYKQFPFKELKCPYNNKNCSYKEDKLKNIEYELRQKRKNIVMEAKK